MVFLLLPFYCDSVESARWAHRGWLDRTRIDNVYCRVHSIRDNNDLSAIRCKMSARSRGITFGGPGSGIADETFHAPNFGFMISRDFFRPLNKARGAPLNYFSSDKIYEVSIKITRETERERESDRIPTDHVQRKLPREQYFLLPVKIVNKILCDAKNRLLPSREIRQL